MITRDIAAFERVLSQLPCDRPAVPRAILLVVDAAFRPGEETAADNVYLQLDGRGDPERALAQQFELSRLLMSLGVPVLSVAAPEGTADAVFPNNVFGTAPGRFVIGSMKFPNRRREARRDDLPALFRAFGYRIVDLSRDGHVAELTGPLIIDRARGIGWCGMSGRVDEAGCQAMHDAFDLRLTLQFDLQPGEYHTNVVMSVLAGRAALVHPSSIVGDSALRALGLIYGKEGVLVLNDDEKAAFAGNCLAVTDRDVVISRTAEPVLSDTARAFFQRHGFRLHAIEVDELERAGGSVRCMMCEVF